MVRDIEINNTILLLDNYASDSHKLHTSLKKAGKDNIVVVNMDLSDLSSTYIRKNVLDKKIVKYLDSEVYQYILGNHLYINEV